MNVSYKILPLFCYEIADNHLRFFQSIAKYPLDIDTVTYWMGKILQLITPLLSFNIVLLVYCHRQPLSFAMGILNRMVKLTHMCRWHKIVVLIGTFVMLNGAAFAQSKQRLTVFAAISSRPAVQPLLDLFQTEKNVEVQVSYASSAILAKQIQRGAKADIFISADWDWVDYLEGMYLIFKENVKPFLGNKLVIVSHQTDSIVPFTDINLVQKLLALNEKVAVGDPQIVPLGRYTKQMLENLKLLEFVQSHLVKALDAQATAKLVERRETRFGVVYLTDASSNPMLKILFIFPSYSHDPITYPVALIGNQPSADAIVLYQFLQENRHHGLIEQQGFSIP